MFWSYFLYLYSCVSFYFPSPLSWGSKKVPAQSCIIFSLSLRGSNALKFDAMMLSYIFCNSVDCKVRTTE